MRDLDARLKAQNGILESAEKSRDQLWGFGKTDKDPSPPRDPKFPLVLFDPPIAWISSAVWLEHRERLLVVDVTRNRLSLYGPDGGLAETLEWIHTRPDARLWKYNTKYENQHDFFFPTEVALGGGLLWLRLVGNDNVFALDGETLGVLGQSRILSQNKILTSAHEWAVGSDYLFTVGDWSNARHDKWKGTGVFRLPLGGDAFIRFHGGEVVSGRSLSVQQSLPLINITSWGYYIVGYDYLATYGDRAYFLQMDEKSGVHLLEIDGDGAVKSLPNAVPAGYQTIEKINAKMSGPRDAPARYDQLEHMKMITGIYVAYGSLYLVARDPVPGQPPNWWLFEVDPETGSLERRAPLPTHAAHLTVVTTPDELLLVERGKVNPYGGQDIPGFVRFPVGTAKWDRMWNRHDTERLLATRHEVPAGTAGPL